MRDLGWKAAAVNLSDLAASGAVARLCRHACRARGDRGGRCAQADEGIVETGVPVIGGDTTEASQLVLSVTALGRSPRVPGRSGARPGDALVVTGPLGAPPRPASRRSSTGSTRRSSASTCARRSAWPRGAGWPPSNRECFDLSDGLATDGGHLAARSGCRVVVELEQVPVANGVVDVAAHVNRSPWELVCAFGEDLPAARRRCPAQAARERLSGHRALRAGRRRRPPPGC